MSEEPTFDERIEQQAIAWYARLSGGTASRRDRCRFRAWLEQDARHAQAYAELNDLWGRLDEPAKALGSGGWYRPSPPARVPLARLAAPVTAIVLVLAIGLLFWRDPGIMDRTLADYATPPGKQLEVTLADSSEILLDGDSALNASFTDAHRLFTLLRGRAWFDVKRNAGRPFIVQTAEVSTRVLGTAFAVTIDGEQVSVIVEQGKVAVNRGDAEFELTGGEHITMSPGADARVAPIDTEAALAWRRGLLVLDRARLSRVVRELDRLSTGRVVLADAAMADQTLSGVFRIDSPDSILKALHGGFGIEATRIPSLVTILHR